MLNFLKSILRFFFPAIVKPPHALGATPSPEDYRSPIISYIVNDQTSVQSLVLQSTLQTNFQQFGILDQNQEPACVSHSIVELLKLWYFLKTGKIIDFSPRFLDILSGLLKYNGYGDLALDAGRDPLTVLKILQKYGCATEATLSNNTNLSLNQYRDSSVITQAVLDEAAQYKGINFAQVNPLTQENLRKFIQQYGAVSILFRIGQELWTDKNGNVTYSQSAIDPLRPPKKIVGGHQMTGSGWNASDLNHVVNEWGIGWAQQGEADYLWNEWSPYIMEAWALVDVPQDALQLVQGLPRPGEFVHNFTQQLSYGMSNDEVRALQIALSIDGEFVYPEISGYYGTITANAVLAFQYKYGVAPNQILAQLQGMNSVVGPATLRQLNKLFNK